MLDGTSMIAVIPVTDLDRARDFYEGVLGLQVFTEPEDQMGIMYESAGTMLMVYQRATASSGEHTVAGFAMSMADFDAVADALLDAGVTFDTFEVPGVDMPWDDRGVLNDGTRASAWFKDPDGNVLSIVGGDM